MKSSFWRLGLALGMAAPPAPGITIRDLETWVNRGEVRSVEEAIRRLPPAMRARFVLMERSRSLQEASASAPRAILHDERAELMVSFNGAPGQRGYGTLEAIGRDASGLHFELRRFDFTVSPARVSPPNPKVCVTCHRSFVRPNWEPYPYWPGALGEGPRYTAQERKRLRELADKAGTHPLYKQLDWTAALTQGFSSTPAFQLYSLLTDGNLDRDARLIAGSADFARFRPWILAALSDCPDVERFPAPSGTWKTLKADTDRRFHLLPAPYRPLLTSAVPSVMAKLRLVLETRGFPVDALPNSFTERFFLTAHGAIVPQLLSRLPGLPPKVPWGALKGYFQPGSHPYGAAERKAHAEWCERLRRESKIK